MILFYSTHSQGCAEIRSAWETREQSLKLVHNSMHSIAYWQSASSILLSDCHRLPLRPILRGGIKTDRPLIIKLTNTADKHLILSKLKFLKTHNESRRLNQTKKYQYITEHLPKQFQEERQLLLPKFKEARRLKQNTSWRVEKGHYTLYIDDVKVFG